jgi:hypothetical protein
MYVCLCIYIYIYIYIERERERERERVRKKIYKQLMSEGTENLKKLREGVHKLKKMSIRGTHFYSYAFKKPI